MESGFHRAQRAGRQVNQNPIFNLVFFCLFFFFPSFNLILSLVGVNFFKPLGRATNTFFLRKIILFIFCNKN